YTDEGFEAFSSVSQVIYQVEDLITEEPTQLPSQLLIRLSDHRSPTIEKFCERLKRQSSHTWLRPLLAEQPDSRQPLERIINTGHNQDISLAAISGDGRWAITSTGGAYFKVWDLEVFRESATCHLAYGEETFKSDFGPRLSALGITYDGRFAVVSITKHREKTILQVWDLSACEAIDSYMLSESGDWPSSISISQDSNVVIVGRSYSTENYIWVRDARSDKNLPYSPPLGYGFTHSVITYQGESLSIVAVSPDASWAAVHHSGLLQIVNLSNGRIVQFFPASDVKRLQINGQNLTALLGDFSIQTWSIDASLTKQSSSVNFLKIYQKPEHPYVSTSASLVIMARIAVSSLFSPSIKRFILNRRWTKRYLSILLLLIQKGISKIRKRESRTSVKPIDFVYLWKILKKSLPPTNTVKKTAQLYRAEPLIDISPEANKGVTTLKDKLQVMNLSGSFIVTTKEKKIRKKTVDELQDLNTLQTDWLQKNTTICLGTDGRSIVTQPKARRKYGKPPAVLKVRDLFSRDSAAPESIPLKATMFSSRTMAAQYISSPFYSRNIGQRTGELYLRAVEFLRGNMLFGNIIFPRPWWQTKSISACGRYALLQSPTCTLKITDQKTGKSLGVLHDLSCFLDNSYFFINVSDEKGSSACISSEGKYVLIYGTYCFPKYIDSSTSRYIGNRYLHDTRGKLLHDFGGIYSIAGVDQKDRTGVYVWNVSERCISSINISERVRFAFPSQNKALFLVGSTNKLFILDPSNLSIVSSYSSKADITSAAISEDGSLVAYADSRQVVKVFDTKNGKVIGAISLSYIAIDLKIFSSDGELVYVSALDTEGKPYLFYLQILAADKSNIKQSEFSYELNSELVVKPATVNWEQISEPVPQRGVDFQLLSSYLAKEEWKRADEITSAIICKFFDDSDRKQFDFSLVPHSVLTSLDEIWLKHSRGRYGFSVQLFIALMLRRVEPYMSERSCPEDNTALLEFDTSKFRSITGHARFNKAFKGEKFSQLRGHYPTILLRGKFSWLIRKSLSQF
ncbi:MAG: GUN4 domain-containing protein, partial [Bacteroidota bacterium]